MGAGSGWLTHQEEEQARQLSDVDACTARAANEVRMAALQMRALTDVLAQRG